MICKPNLHFSAKSAKAFFQEGRGEKVGCEVHASPHPWILPRDGGFHWKEAEPFLTLPLNSHPH
jgi:hypothetical protein